MNEQPQRGPSRRFVEAIAGLAFIFGAALFLVGAFTDFLGEETFLDIAGAFMIGGGVVYAWLAGQRSGEGRLLREVDHWVKRWVKGSQRPDDQN